MTTQSDHKVTKSEVAVVGVILVSSLALLLPALPASRETARANHCQRRLRWLDLATNSYIEHQQRLPAQRRGLPEYFAWPTELLSYLQTESGVDKSPPGADIFAMTRPVFLTCPSRPDISPVDGQPQLSHYTLVIDRSRQSRWDQVRWKYRDSPLDPSPEPRKVWYLGDEINWETAEEQLQSARGPHADGAFQESDSQGGTVVRSLQSGP